MTTLRRTMRVKRSDYILSGDHGPLYVIDTFRDSSGRCFVGINGADGVQYSCEEGDVVRHLTDGEVEEMRAAALKTAALKGGE